MRATTEVAHVKPRAGGQAPERRQVRLWLALLSAIGLLLSGYMLWTRAAHAPVYCPLGPGCDVVQSSRYAAVFGAPVALLGLLFYAALVFLGLRPMDPQRRAAIALPVTFAGAAASIVFTIVQRVIVRATCSLCLLSAALTLVILLMVLMRRPVGGGRGVWAWSVAAAVVAAGFLLWGYAASAPVSAEQQYAQGLARHLTAAGVKFYGAYWCPHCSDQKKMFGAAAALLPYIECDARSPVGKPQECAAAQIRAFPTWDINGKRYEGVLSLLELAHLTGHPPPP